jgi:predicted transcriptional regulator
MSNTARTILEVLFPTVRARVLRLLFTAAGKQQYVRQLAVSSGLALHTVQDELRKLGAVGLLISWSNGFHRFYQPNREHPLYPELCRIVQVSESFPRTKDSKLARVKRPAARRPKARKPRPLPKDWPVKWHLFSQGTGVRRL